MIRAFFFILVIFITPALAEETRVELGGEVYPHYYRPTFVACHPSEQAITITHRGRLLRLKVGDRFVVYDLHNKSYPAEVLSIKECVASFKIPK